MRLRPRTEGGYGLTDGPKVSALGVPVELHGWESLEVPDALGRFLIGNAGGELRSCRPRWIYPYQIAVVETCP